MTTEVLHPQPAVEDVEAIVVEVFTALGLEAGPGADAVEKDDGTVAGAVSVTGAWEGHIVVRCGGDTAREIAAMMLGLDDGSQASPEDVDDALGELTNMIGGNVKALMPDPSALTLPRLFTGVDEERYPQVSRTVQAHAATPFGPLSVHVWQRTA